MSENKISLDKEKIMSFLGDAMRTIKTEEDPAILNEYRHLFRKAVPLTMRSYVAGYLIKQFEKQNFPKSREYGRKNTRSKFNPRERTPSAEHQVIDRPVLDQAESTSIFISVGRNRRVFPRDIITLLIQKAEVTRERIGDIRILDNYSFVQVMSEDADQIIEKLNNFLYRGKTLVVSHSRKQEDEQTSQEESSEYSENVATSDT